MKIKHYQPLTYVTYSIVGITVLAGILLSCNIPIFPGISVNGSTSATTLNRTASTTAAIRVKSTCSMTATIEPGEEHAATMINGQYRNDIGLTTIQTFCNDPNGYAIYAIGYTGGDEGVAEGTNTVLHSNALGSTYDIITGTSTNGLDNDDTSNWAMKLTALGTTDTYRPNILSDDNGTFSDYHIVPSTYTKVASYPTATDLDNPASTRLGSNLTTTYAAYISNTQPAGTYEGQVKYVLVHPSNSLSPNFNMQNVDEWGPTIAIGEEVTADDLRDGKSYTVRRMCMEGTGNTWQEKEANCTSSMLWMTQNLDLDLDNSIALTSKDTDLNVSGDSAYVNGYTTDAYGMISWAPASTTITSIDTSTGKFNGWTNDSNVAYSADPDAGNPDNPWYATGEAYNSDLCYVSNGSQTCNYLNVNNTVAPAYFSHTPFTGNGSHGKIGNYYNWSAAIASNNSSSLTSSTYNNVTNNPQNSICPKGWRLPTTSTVAAKNEFARLNNVYNSGSTGNGTGLINSPVYMVRSGYVNGGSLYDAGCNSYYWSSTVYNAGNAYILYFRSGYVDPASNYYRFLGWSVRCVSDYQ